MQEQRALRSLPERIQKTGGTFASAGDSGSNRLAFFAILDQHITGLQVYYQIKERSSTKKRKRAEKEDDTFHLRGV